MPGAQDGALLEAAGGGRDGAPAGNWGPQRGRAGRVSDLQGSDRAWGGTAGTGYRRGAGRVLGW